METSGESKQELTEEEIAARAQEFLTGVLERMGIEATVTIADSDDKIVLDIDCEEPERVIGRRGQVVDALQHLVGKALAKRRTGRGKPLIVDAAGYRDRYIERLQSLASRMGEKALESKDEVALNPMSAHDRRIIHMQVAEMVGLTTRSDGEGDDRHVVVVPDGDASPDADAAEASPAE